MVENTEPAPVAIAENSIAHATLTSMPPYPFLDPTLSYAERVENLLEYAIVFKMNDPVSFFYYLRNHSAQPAIPKNDPLSGPCLFTRLYQTLPVIAGQTPEQEYLYMSSRLFSFSEQTSRYDLRVVYNDAVSRLHILHDIGKMPVLHLACLLIKNEKSGRTSILQRILGNQFFRKIIVKILSFE